MHPVHRPLLDLTDNLAQVRFRFNPAKVQFYMTFGYARSQPVSRHSIFRLRPSVRRFITTCYQVAGCAGSFGGCDHSAPFSLISACLCLRTFLIVLRTAHCSRPPSPFAIRLFASHLISRSLFLSSRLRHSGFSAPGSKL